jgi:rhodanese-related sulfurtransferase
MSIPSITAEQAHRLILDGAVLIDVRDADEYAREHIPGAKVIPISEIGRTPLPADARAFVFHCRSGNRTTAHRGKLISCTNGQAYILDGGLDAWKRAGLPVNEDRSQPLELLRQVQITAGLLVLVGVVLGHLAFEAFYLLAAVVGAGLVLAGVTGTCGMARVLKLMPWNRTSAARS